MPPFGIVKRRITTVISVLNLPNPPICYAERLTHLLPYSGRYFDLSYGGKHFHLSYDGQNFHLSYDGQNFDLSYSGKHFHLSCNGRHFDPDCAANGGSSSG